MEESCINKNPLTSENLNIKIEDMVFGWSVFSKTGFEAKRFISYIMEINVIRDKFQMADPYQK